MARWAEKYDVRNSWQVIAGAILIPLGVVLILLGWYGAAHARVVQQQIPYMVSGSFIGLGCMIVGGLLFFGHWLYRIYDQADLQHEEQQRVLETIAAALWRSAAMGRRRSAGRRVVAVRRSRRASRRRRRTTPLRRGRCTTGRIAPSSGTIPRTCACSVPRA